MVTRREFIRCGALLLASGLVPGCRNEKSPAEGVTSAERAVKAARQFAGTTLTVAWESGAQAMDLRHFSGPRWEELTGIRVNLVEMSKRADMFRRLEAEHRAGTAAIDCASIAPAWVPDLLEADALEPLDDYISRYGVATDREDYLPLYRSLGTWSGKTYGLFDDGDILLLYYRQDLFDDASNQRAFAARFGRPLKDPRSFEWQDVLDASRFFTETHAPDLYGMAPLGRSQTWSWFQAYLRANGGRFFNPATMRAEVDGTAGLRALENLLALEKTMPPTYGGETNETILTSYLSGRTAMASFWPPLGRWAEGYGHGTPSFKGVPSTQIAGKTGYALLPGGVTEQALGFMLSVMARSRHPEAAYLFIQWLNSPEISLQRVTLPYSFRDPYRLSHVRSPAYRQLWPTAPAYLETLRQGADVALLDLILPGAFEYEEAFFVALTDVRLGAMPEEALRRMAETWNVITERFGRGRQKRAYEAFLARPGALPKGRGQ
jgi:multiple sugar transport system substrate-binding protein